MKIILVAAALALPAAAFAQQAARAPVAAAPAASTVSLSSKAFVVRQVPDANGKLKNTLAPVDRVLPGDVLVFMLDYRNGGAKPVTPFVINNPVPANVAFTGVEQPWASVTVDGGKTYGPLAKLTVRKADGTSRAALPADVTAIRWTFGQPIAAGASGNVKFYAVVK